jgi:hypothetical protein
VTHGETGFLCTDEAEAALAVEGVGELGRAACRASVENRFSMARMARDHVALYESVMNGPGLATVQVPAPRRSAGGLARVDVNAS